MMAPNLNVRRKSELMERVALFNKKVEEHHERQLSNPFSDVDRPADFVIKKLDIHDPNYGRPVAGSKTAIRGQQASEHMRKELKVLCEVIHDCGYKLRDGRAAIAFGSLFTYYNAISDKCVGNLMSARKHKLVTFEGEMLYQRRDDDTIITLTQPYDELCKLPILSGAPPPSPEPAVQIVLTAPSSAQVDAPCSPLPSAPPSPVPPSEEAPVGDACHGPVAVPMSPPLPLSPITRSQEEPLSSGQPIQVEVQPATTDAEPVPATELVSAVDTEPVPVTEPVAVAADSEPVSTVEQTEASSDASNVIVSDSATTITVNKSEMTETSSTTTVTNSETTEISSSTTTATNTIATSSTTITEAIEMSSMTSSSCSISSSPVTVTTTDPTQVPSPVAEMRAGGVAVPTTALATVPAAQPVA